MIISCDLFGFERPVVERIYIVDCNRLTALSYNYSFITVLSEIFMIQTINRFTPYLLVLTLLASSNTSARNAHAKIVGKWNCGPVVMKAPNATITVNWSVNYLPDHTFIDLVNTQVDATDRPSFSTTSRSKGRWELKGDALESQSTKEEFIGATDPFITKELGQRVLDEQVAAKPIPRSRILKLNKKELHTFPINARNKEAEVTTTCVR